MIKNATITLQREKVIPLYMLNKFEVVLDDKEIGEISNGENKSFKIDSGKHTLFVKIAYDLISAPKNEYSEPIEFIIKEKQNMNFDCGVNVDTSNILITILSPILSMLTKDKKLYLKKE